MKIKIELDIDYENFEQAFHNVREAVKGGVPIRATLELLEALHGAIIQNIENGGR